MKSIAFGTHLPVMGFVRKETVSREQLISFAQKAEELGYNSLSETMMLVEFLLKIGGRGFLRL